MLMKVANLIRQLGEGTSNKIMFPQTSIFQGGKIRVSATNALDLMTAPSCGLQHWEVKQGKYSFPSPWIRVQEHQMFTGY